jgi:hypothetical protein
MASLLDRLQKILTGTGRKNKPEPDIEFVSDSRINTRLDRALIDTFFF